MSINVTYPADYPAVEVCGPNPSLARLLNNDLSAAKSEMTAIHQYTYRGWKRIILRFRKPCRKSPW